MCNRMDTHFKSLLSLDDMVLLKITNNLNVSDLANLGKTCKRLKYLTQHHFKKHYSNVRWRKNRNGVKLCESSNIFGHIGKYLQTINLAFWSDCEFYNILLILGTECSHLNSFTLDSIRMNRSLKLCDPVISEMFSKLQQFVMKRCYWTGCCPLEIFFGCNSTLQELSIIDCRAGDGNYKLHLKEFRGLKELKVVECGNLLSSVELQRCFENNNITTLSLGSIGNVNLFQQHLINSLCFTVESLTFDYHKEIDFGQLVRLTKLKRLRLQSGERHNVDGLLSKLNPGIEELEVINIFITSATMEALKKFIELKHLAFERCSNSISDDFFIILPTILPNLRRLVYTYNVVTDCDIVHMVKLMPQLTHLSLFGCNNLVADTYLEIVDILTKDSQRSKLRFTPPRLESLKILKILEKF